MEIHLETDGATITMNGNPVITDREVFLVKPRTRTLFSWQKQYDLVVPNTGEVLLTFYSFYPFRVNKKFVLFTKKGVAIGGKITYVAVSN